MIEDIITDVLKAEGWDTYTDHPADKGGPTKWGITQKRWDEYQDRQGWPRFSVKEITERKAREFYEGMYIMCPNFHTLPAIIMPLVIDSGVNSGVRAASKWLQRAVGVRQDGWVGDKTLAAVKASNHIAVFLRIVSYRAKLYGRLVSRDPKLKLAKEAGFRLQAEFAAGWNNRVMGFLERLAQSLD